MSNPFISSWQIYRTLIVDGVHYLRTHKKTWLALLSCCVAIVLFLLLLPLFLQPLVDQTQLEESATFKHYFLLLILSAVILSVLVGFYHFTCNLFSQSIVSVLLSSLYYYFIFQSPFHYTDHAQAAFARYLQDVEKLKQCLKEYLPDIAISFLLTISSFIMIWLVSPSLTAVTLFALCLLTVMILFSRRYDKIPRQQSQQLQQEDIDFIQSHLTAITTTQAFNQQDRSMHLLFQQQALHQKEYQQLYKTKGIFLAISTLMTCCVLLGVFWYGYFMSSHDKLSLGALVQYICYVAYIIFALRKLLTTQQKMLSVGQSYFNIKTLLATPFVVQSPLIADTFPSVSDKGISLQCEEISFSYPHQPDNPALHSIHLDINAGECIALIGPVGSGKSTLLHLLLRFMDPTTGKICFNQTDIRWLSLTALRQHIGYVPQDTFLFTGTVVDNMRLGESFYSDEQIIELTQQLGIEAYFLGLKNGFNTLIDHNEDILPWVGYLISLVRALLHHPALLLIDSIPHTFDHETESIIYSALQKAMQSQTTLIVTHHRQTMQQCDRLLHLEHGQITAFDTYQQLYGDA